MNRILLGTTSFLLFIIGAWSHLPVTAMRQAIAKPLTPSIQSQTTFRSFFKTIQGDNVGSHSRQSRGQPLKVADPVSLGIVRPSHVYDTAYQDFVKGRYTLAIQQFEKFVEDFPTNSRAPQAYFYLGECYYNLGDLKLAAQNLSVIITRHQENLPNFQNSRQVPPALFRLGRVYEEAEQLEKAKAFWGILLTDHPDTPEAQLAKKRLKRLP